MGFMDEVAKFGAEDKKCPVARFLGTEKAKGITEELLKQAVTTYGPKSPWLAMRQRGYDGSQESVSKHARGVCSCLRTS